MNVTPGNRTMNLPPILMAGLPILAEKETKVFSLTLFREELDRLVSPGAR